MYFYDAQLLLRASLFITCRAQEALDKNLRWLAIKIHSGFNFLPFPAGHKCVNRERAAGLTYRLGCSRPVRNAHSRTFSHCSARAAPPAVLGYF